MAYRQSKNGNQPQSSEKDDAQIINELIENRKHQMDALIKIMLSMDMTDEVAPQLERPSTNKVSTKKAKTFNRRIKK